MAPNPGPGLALDAIAGRITERREGILNRWRVLVRRLPTAERLDAPTLNNHIPALLDDLAAALLSGQTDSVLTLHLSNSPEVHGHQRLRSGFDIVEVVAEYNILREVLQSVIEEGGLELAGQANQILNRIIDRAIAIAVDTYAKERAIEVQQRREEHLSFMIHDLRTPLSALTVSREVLERSLPAEALNEQVRNMLELQRRNSRRLAALITGAMQEQYNIAAHSPDEVKVERREFDLWPLVQEVLRDHQQLTDDKHVELRNEIPRDVQIVADARLILHVFHNLLSNALRYTHQGAIVIRACASPEAVRVSVIDTGDGIAADRLEKVFDKLETDRSQNGGLGLGLTIVKQIMSAHGGSVTVESEIGQGTTFTLTFPNRTRD